MALECEASVPLEKPITAKSSCCFSLSRYPTGDKRDNNNIKLRLSRFKPWKQQHWKGYRKKIRNMTNAFIKN